eukprot:680595-Pyramimonas_sp.AAC.1
MDCTRTTSSTSAGSSSATTSSPPWITERLGTQPLSFFDWMFGNPGNIMAYESSDEDVTVEASPSE